MPFFSRITPAQWTQLEDLARNYVDWANRNQIRIRPRRALPQTPTYEDGSTPILSYLVSFLTNLSCTTRTSLSQTPDLQQGTLRLIYSSESLPEEEASPICPVQGGGRKRKRKKYKTLRKKKTNRKLRKTIRLR